jgi:hypothetical protein
MLVREVVKNLVLPFLTFWLYIPPGLYTYVDVTGNIKSRKLNLKLLKINLVHNSSTEKTNTNMYTHIHIYMY